eukprot:g48341.t1
MVDTLVESSSNVEMILKFFDMFLKLKEITNSDTFKVYDLDSKGIMSKKEFQKALESQKKYTQPEIEFLLSCVEADENDMFNYIDFIDRFHEPAKDIGFNVAVLLTNLSEHMPNDSRLATLLQPAQSVLTYFEPYLGRIEIMGAAKRIERIYFEISESSRTQWEKPQVKESKRQFIFDVVNEGGESEKMELFVNFCEDTIFEMQLASEISEPDSAERADDEEDEPKPTEEESDEEQVCLIQHNLEFMEMWQSQKELKFLRQVTEDGEKKDKAKEEQPVESEGKEQKERKQRRGQKKKQPEAFLANFWEGLEIYQTKILNYLARNFYNLRLLALFVAFAINFILLFYKVTEPPEDDEEEDFSFWNDDNVDYYVLQETTGYMAPTLTLLAINHTIISMLCIIGYYILKVPLVVFKREKEIARKLEFDGLYITEQPSDDDIKGQWDRLVINT